MKGASGIETILIPHNVNRNHWVLFEISLKHQSITLMDSMATNEDIQRGLFDRFPSLTSFSPISCLKNYPQQIGKVECGDFVCASLCSLVLCKKPLSETSFRPADVPLYWRGLLLNTLKKEMPIRAFTFQNGTKKDLVLIMIMVFSFFVINCILFFVLTCFRLCFMETLLKVWRPKFLAVRVLTELGTTRRISVPVRIANLVIVLVCHVKLLLTISALRKPVMIAS